MRVLSLLQLWLLTLFYNKAFAIIISPCKVQNLITQPNYGTSLKTKGLIQIIQMPPVFVQNVMVGICENHNQNVTTGRNGEFYSCQQRYSIVEVYVADTSLPTTNTVNTFQKPQLTPDSIKFIRESVIIESGCDFTFNLLPLMFNAQGQAENQQGPQPIPPQQKMFLRSPYHPTIPIRTQPPNSEPPIPAGMPPTTPFQNPSQTTAGHPPTLETYTHGRASIDEENLNVEEAFNDNVENSK